MSDPYGKLLEVAARLARGQLVPWPPEGTEWYITTPAAERRRLREESERAADRHKDAAITVRQSADLLAAERDRLRKLLWVAQGILSECDGDYNNPRFTDRHGTGSRITACLAALEQEGIK
jgi:hypothetical protein